MSSDGGLVAELKARISELEAEIASLKAPPKKGRPAHRNTEEIRRLLISGEKQEVIRRECSASLSTIKNIKNEIINSQNAKE